jgi:hypothetical protein
MEYEKIVKSVNPPIIEWGNMLPSIVQSKVQDWMDPSNKRGLYSKNNNKFNDKIYPIKLKNIISEKILLQKLLTYNGILINIRMSRLMKATRLVEMYFIRHIYNFLLKWI